MSNIEINIRDFNVDFTDRVTIQSIKKLLQNMESKMSKLPTCKSENDEVSLHSFLP